MKAEIHPDYHTIKVMMTDGPEYITLSRFRFQVSERLRRAGAFSLEHFPAQWHRLAVRNALNQ